MRLCLKGTSNSFELLLNSVFVVALVIGGKGTWGKMQVAVLYSDYHQRGDSHLLVFEGCQNIPPQFNDKASSIDPRGECIRLYENRCCQGRSIELGANSPYMDDLYNAEFDDTLSSVSPCGNYSSPKPPSLLQENWLNHSELLDKVYSDGDIAIYYDSDVSRKVKWTHEFVGKAWRYLKRSFNLDQIAGLTKNEQLHVIFHSGKTYMKYNSSALTYFDVASECRNIIDISSDDNSTWAVGGGDELDKISEQFGNMVIYLYRGGKDAPTFQYLDKNDADFVKIITFDMYRGIGIPQEEIVRFLRKSLTRASPGSEETEKTHVNWFRDWYFPIYRKFGELSVVRKYLKLSAAYFPTVAATRNFNVTSESDNEHEITPLRMNLGEFIHFWSGVTHHNLQKLAIRAFGWTMLNEYQLIQAQRDFPKLSY